MPKQKGQMRAGKNAVPYSRKHLEALADTLKLHSAMVWLDPVSGDISLKQVGSGSSTELEEEE